MKFHLAFLACLFVLLGEDNIETSFSLSSDFNSDIGYSISGLLSRKVPTERVSEERKKKKELMSIRDTQNLTNQ